MNKDKLTAGDLANSHAEYNPRDSTNDDLDRLKKTLEYYGDLSGIVFNVRSATIVGGHQRQKTLDPSWKIVKSTHKDQCGTVSMGYIETDYGRLSYREVDWDLQKEMGANLAANNPAGDWVFSKRLDILESLDTGGFDMDLTGHSPDELERLFTWTQDDDARLNSLFKKEDKGDASNGNSDVDDSGTDSNSGNGSNGDIPNDQLTVVKVNLTIEQRDWLDGFFEEKGLKSRSDGIRYVLQSFRGLI